MEDTFAQSVVIDMIRKYGNVVKEGVVNNRCYFKLENKTIIQLKEGFQRVPMVTVKLIALEQLEIGIHEFDYWLGELDKKK